MRIVLHEGVDLHSQACLRRTLFSVQLEYFKLTLLQYTLSAFRNVTLGRSSRSRFRYRRETADWGQKTPKLDFCKTEHQGLPGCPTGRNRSRAHPPAYTHTPSQQSEKGG